jgi:hypothetical protein
MSNFVGSVFFVAASSTLAAWAEKKKNEIRGEWVTIRIRLLDQDSNLEPIG